MGITEYTRYFYNKNTASLFIKGRYYKRRSVNSSNSITVTS